MLSMIPINFDRTGQRWARNCKFSFVCDNVIDTEGWSFNSLIKPVEIQLPCPMIAQWYNIFITSLYAVEKTGVMSSLILSRQFICTLTRTFSCIAMAVCLKWNEWVFHRRINVLDLAYTFGSELFSLQLRYNAYSD